MPFRLPVALSICLFSMLPRVASAQETIHVGTEAALQSAISTAPAGSTIVLDANITLTADLPSVSNSVTIDGGGHTLSGANQFRGLLVAGWSASAPTTPSPINVTVQNLTIANTVAQGGSGGNGSAGGGGGAGLGGAIFVGNSAAVTVSNVNIISSAAVGGNGGNANADTDGGGGGGLGGNGASGLGSGAGGGGVGRGANGGDENVANGGTGTLTGASPGGGSGVSAVTSGGANGGGGNGGGFGGAGGGNGGGLGGINGSGGGGGYGGGGGGATQAAAPTSAGGGGFGGGGGGGDGGGFGGFGAGGGGSTGLVAFGNGFGGEFAGAGADGFLGNGNGGGGGAGLGGAIFVSAGGTLNFGGGLTVNGSSVTGGTGGTGAQNGSAFGSGLYLQGNGVLTSNQAAGQTATISNDIADERGIVGPPCIDCAIPGQWGIDKQGAGTLVLTGSNVYSAGTQVEAGTLQINTAQNIGSGSVSLFNGSTLDIRGTSVFGNSLSLGGVSTVSVASGQQATWNGVITDSSTSLGFPVIGLLSVTGGGTLSLGNTANTYSAGTMVHGNSTVEIGADGALGSAIGGVTLGDPTSGGTLRFTSGSLFTTSRSVTLGLGGGTLDTAGTANITIASAISGQGGLTKTGTGTLTLSAANAYAGGTIVNQGTLRTSIANAFAAGGGMTVASGATFDLNSFSQTVGSLSGAGSVTLGNATLTTGGNGASTLFSGAISGAGSLVKNGAGTLQLTGANSYSGGTTVNAGTLLGTTSSLQGNVTNNSLVVFGQNTSGAYAGQMSGTGTLGFVGTGTLSLNSGNTYSGGTAVSGGGTISIAADSALGAATGGVSLGSSTTSGAISFQPGSVFTSARGFSFGSGGAILDTAGTSSITLSGSLAGAGALTKTGIGTLTLTGASSYSGGTTVSAGILIGSTSSLQGNILNNASVVFSQSASGAYSGSMSGTGSLTKTGSGTLFLTGANSYSGGTTVSGGTLMGTTSSLQGNILNNSLVVFAQNNNGGYGGAMSGSGALALVGAGTVALNAGNSYTGGTTVIGGGTVSIGADSALGAAAGGVTLGDSTSTGTISFQNGSAFSSGRSFVFGGAGAILDTEGTSSISLNGGLSGAGGLTKIGTGTLTLGGTASYAGPTSILAGALRTNSTNVFDANAPLTLAGGTSLDLAGFNQAVGSLSGAGSVALGAGTLTTGGDGTSTAFSGSISGSGGLSKIGGGTMTLLGANTYTGGTTVSGGALIGNTTSIQGNVLNNALVVFNQGPDGTYAGSMSGSGVLEKAGSGVLTLTGTNTYTGGTIIDSGSVVGTASSLQGTIVNNGSLTLLGSDTATFNGLITGKGSITKAGTGTLTLSGTNPVTGLFNDSQGTLAINGAFGGSINVASGATLRASGFIAGSLALQGSLFVVPPPGQSQSSSAAQHVSASMPSPQLDVPPSLVLGGNLSATPGSLINFAIGPGVNPTVAVGGAATLNGTHFSVTAPSIGTARSQSFLAMTAANGLTMQNTDVVTPDPTVIPVLKQEQSDLIVTVLNLNIPLASVTAGGNRGSVAGAIDRIKLGATGDLAFVIHELTALDNAGLNNALDQVGGQIHASALQTAVIEADAMTEIARTEAGQAREVSENGQLHFWTQFNCQHASYKGNNDAQGGSADVCTGAGGADRVLNDHWMVGGGGGFGSGSLGLNGSLGSSDYHAPRAFGYGGWRPKTSFGVAFGGSVAKSSYTTQRPIQFVATLPTDLGGEAIDGGVDRQAQSNQTGTSSDAWSQISDNRKVKTYTIEGLLGFRHARFSRQGWTETGADALSLAGDANQTLALSETDVRIHGYRHTGTYRPYFSAFYRRELTNAQTATELSFAGAGNSNFTILGLPVPGNTYMVQGGATMILRLGQLSGDYTFLHSSNETRQSLGLRFRFK